MPAQVTGKNGRAPNLDVESIDADVIDLGRRLAARRRFAVKRTVYDRSMAAFAADPELRAALFRLVDVAPACADSEELAEHLAAYLDQVDAARLPVVLGYRVAESPLLSRPTGRVASAVVRQMAHRFIVGETAGAAVPTLGSFWERGFASTVDLLGEATVTYDEGDDYADRCDEAMQVFAAAAARWPSRPRLEADSAGPIPRVNLSVKVTALTPLIRPDAPDRAREDVVRHLRRLLRRAADVGAHLHVDMESMDSRELILSTVLDLIAEPEFATGPSVGIVLQAYLRDSEEILDEIIERTRAAHRAVPLTVRLVKGAYWDHETIEATQHGWSAPVWTDKAESDRCFERLSGRLADAFPLVRPAFASHNLRSIAHAVVRARRAGLGDGDFELQVLRGLGDHLQEAIAAAGFRCRTYCPVGDMVSGMSYLVRRLLENTSNDSFLATRASGSGLDQMLVRP